MTYQVRRDASIGRRGRAADLLGQIELAGWRLEHANWVYVQTGQNSRNNLIATGQQVVVTEKSSAFICFVETRSADNASNARTSIRIQPEANGPPILGEWMTMPPHAYGSEAPTLGQRAS
ncbi:MAG: hypothetical protein ACXWEI_05830 [Mycobacterium sp.]